MNEDKEREAFEAAHNAMDITRCGAASYLNKQVNDMWSGWQSRAAQPAEIPSSLTEQWDAHVPVHPPQPMSSEPVGWMYEGIASHTKGKIVVQPEHSQNLETRWWREVGPVYTAPQPPAECVPRGLVEGFLKAGVESVGYVRIVDNKMTFVPNNLDPETSSLASGDMLFGPNTYLRAERVPHPAEEVCAQVYQVVGSMLADLGIFDTDKATKVLDNLAEAKIVHDDVLPWEPVERVPLTDEQRANLIDEVTPCLESRGEPDLEMLIDLVEAAHGIKGQP